MGKNLGLPPYVQSFRDKTGKRRFYLRKAGVKRTRLPDPTANKKAFAAAYTMALGAGLGDLKDQKAGTMEALILEYLRSSDYRELKPNTKTLYNHIIRFLRARPSVAKPVKNFTRAQIETLRDEVAEETPGKANMLVAVMRVLFKFAMRRDYRTDNPAVGIKPLKGGEHRSWTDAELEQFRERWKRGTMERMAFDLALYTGQRKGDLCRMTWADVKDGGFHVAQEKTGEKVWIKCHTDLAGELERAPRTHAVVLATSTGRAFSTTYLGAWFATAIDAAGLPSACVLHGLRKAAARRLAEAGCTDREIMAITGHRSLAMVSHYTKGADQKTRSDAAVVKLERMDRKRSGVKPVKSST